ncbi:MAG TPA: hypothetical protein PLP42_03045 [Acidobacteriota bacterium]|nr:hypothetical protein [Acidobacteriota bacterium]
MRTLLSIFGPTTPGEEATAVAAGLRAAGANSLLFFTSLYYGYRLILRRYPQCGIYSLEADRVFYEPDPSFYADCSLQPRRSLDCAGDLVAQLTAACASEGVDFLALVPMCAGSLLVQERPELAVVNLFGSHDRLFFCYNNPEVRKYRAAMVRELVCRYPIQGIMLDKIPQAQLELRAQNGLFDPPLRTVGSFCFCSHCQARAARSDLDLEAVRRRCLEIARRSLDVPPYLVAAQEAQLVGDTEIPLLLLEEPLIYQMLQFRFETAVEFVAEIRAVAKGVGPDVRVEAAFVPPCHVGHDMTSPRSWLTVQSYQKYRDVLDAILCVVHFDPDVVRFETQRAVASAEGRVPITTSMRLYGPTRPEEVERLAEAALAGGSDGVSFLGYDVATDELLRSLARWAKSRG